MGLRLNSSEIFKVLSADTRIKIIRLLKVNGATGVKTIAQVLGITPPAASQHLKVLKNAGLVTSTRNGYWIPYAIDEEAMENFHLIVDDLCKCGCKGKCRLEGKGESSLASLLKYKEELENELKVVKSRIEQIKSNKNN
ncbi:MAG: hypothetical protein A2W19_04490 [Spirochaetes bacterium RBG_16_49_21]|nr:MAG: hypothetical protein A2W19_04490 [Spirochaetes bacterium RBG_16_49_21]